MTDVMTKAEKSLGTLGRAIQKAGGKAVTGWSVAFGELTVEVRRDDIVVVLTRLRDQFEFQQLTDLAGVDYPERTERFDVVYHLLSLTKNLRLRVRVTTDERAPVPSITGVYPAADWFEREAFDMYGMLFSGHPDLRRLLTDYGFQGYPLRKDFPMTGYVEVRYDEEQKRVVYEPVKLAQEFRNFDFLSPWEGAEYAAPVLPGDEKAIGSAGKPSGGKA
jgi:NADH-quinone oxidoreductase subunit C